MIFNARGKATGRPATGWVAFDSGPDRLGPVVGVGLAPNDDVAGARSSCQAPLLLPDGSDNGHLVPLRRLGVVSF